MNPGVLLANASELVTQGLFAVSTKNLKKGWELELHYLDRKYADRAIDVLEDPNHSALGVWRVEAVYVRSKSNYYLMVRFDGYQEGKIFHSYLIDIMDSTGA